MPASSCNGIKKGGGPLGADFGLYQGKRAAQLPSVFYKFKKEEASVNE
jgi:hypothetical protein